MPLGVSRSDWRAYACLIFLCLTLYVPGLTTIPPVDRDEAYYAQATKQMLDSGDFVRPRFHTRSFFEKPIGIYWLQSAAIMVTGQYRRAPIWTYRLPSVFGALTAVLLTYWVGRRLFHRRAALLGAALLATSLLLVVEAHLATTDAVLLACVMGAQGCLAGLYVAARRGVRGPAAYAAGFWFAQGLGILVKGPVAPLVSGLTLATLAFVDRHSNATKLPNLRWRWGVPLVSLVVLPWAVVVGTATDWTFYRDWIGEEIIPKIVGAQKSHGFPPGFYLLLLAATFWPGSLAIGLGLTRAFRRRGRCAERFCLAWLVPLWIFFELMPTKLPHYVLPMYPALALLAARAALAGRVPLLQTRVVRCALVLWGLLTSAMGIAVAAGTVVFGSGLDLTGVSAAAVAAAIGGLCVWLYWRGRPARASWIAVGGSVVLFALALQWALPEMHALWLSRAVSIAVARQAHGYNGSRPLAATGYQEPSLVFLAGSDVAFVDPKGAAMFLKERRDGLALVSDDQRAAFAQAANEIGLQPRPVWSTDGVNYSKGRWVRLWLFDQSPSIVQPGDSPE
jgi:4-amino-4-deoxy-L-arabinose transferase-like glycosyltransferase